MARVQKKAESDTVGALKRAPFDLVDNANSGTFRPVGGRDYLHASRRSRQNAIAGCPVSNLPVSVV
jgi:hypothetical protein